MQASVTWRDHMTFDARSGSGHDLVLEPGAAHGGRDLGPSPMELVLLGVGGCSSVDVVSFLRKMRQDVTDCRCELTAERADDTPAVFTSIHLHFVVAGSDLSETKVARAVALSADKYCSASIMLGRGGVAISHSHEVVAA